MKPHRLALVLALASVTVVACGGDNADLAPPTTTSATTDTSMADMTMADTSGAQATTTLPPYEAPLGDIIGEALVAGQFSTLAGLLVDADLVQALRGAGPFTVFAPTDEAFGKVPAATMDAVFADKNLLTAVLTYHVVAGSYTSADLRDGQELETLQGQKLKITKNGDSIQVNGIDVVVPDVPATNGVIQVISGVLVPEG